MLFRALYAIVLLSISTVSGQPGAEISRTEISPDSAEISYAAPSSADTARNEDPSFSEKRMYRENFSGPGSCTGVVICSQAAVVREAETIASSPYVTRYNAQFPGRPDPRWSVDTAGFSGVETSNGGMRNAGEFWTEWLAKRPETISPKNKFLIENYDRLKVSPRVDPTWVKSFPEQAPYLKDTLYHHHVDFGRYAIRVPGKTHVGSGGPWHAH